LANDFLVTTNSATGQVVLQTTISLPATANVLLHSDGRFYPYLQNGLATVEIRVDGTRISNISALDFRVATPVQHTFNCIGSTYMTAGAHTVQLIAYNHPSVSGGQFYVGSTSNLSIVVNPATTIVSGFLGSDSSYVNVTTLNNSSPLPHQNVVTVTHTASEPPIVVLSSGRSYSGRTAYGDAMWGAYLNDACPPNSQQFWTINDIAPSGELHAPMSGQALYPYAGTYNVQLAATEEPYFNPVSENPVQYMIGSTSGLITLSGGLRISGSAAELEGVKQTV
jgi:hypothetical protein